MADEQNITDVNAPKKKKGKGLIIVVVLGVLLIGGGITAGVVLGKNKDPELAKKKIEEPITMEFKDIFVNVAETKATRVLKLTAVLELSEEGLLPLLNSRSSILRDLISEAASQMTINELENVNGRKKLKREIKDKVNVMVCDWMSGAVVKVYFPDFLTQ